VIGQALYDLVLFIYEPIEYIINQMGLSTVRIKLGIGQVEFFNLTLPQLLSIMVSVVVWYVFVRFVYKLIKSIFGLATRWFR